MDTTIEGVVRRAAKLEPDKHRADMEHGAEPA